ncbi:putative nicastrin [Trichinella spiralis]|uniref:putative nicastrin n=1 Tax=Trichinella spiralis TaxID=6334 RepID=UPI0001EFC532|nr:putative nicastrin [Trichinella spiralis]
MEPQAETSIHRTRTPTCFMNYNYATYGKSVKCPLCASELTDFKLAADDADQCIRKNEIDNIFITQTEIQALLFLLAYSKLERLQMSPQRSSETLAKNHSVFMLMFKVSTNKILYIYQETKSWVDQVDSFTTFYDLDYGSSAISSQLVILAVLEVLRENAHRIADLSSGNNRQLLLALFSGESFDCTGSS